jgi:hypothetical protein
VIIATSLFFALSALVGLAIPAVLGRVGREISELLESDHWASAPLTRDVDEEARQEGASETAVASSATPLAAGQHR